MLKSIAFMPRKPGTRRRDFRSYYETRHSPLAIQYFSFDKYMRSHLIDSEDVGSFDCYSEFWVQDFEPIHILLESDVGEIMRRDELNFTDQPRIAVALAQEILLHGIDRSAREENGLRWLYLLKAKDKAPDTERLARELKQKNWGESLRVTLDLLSPFQPDGSLPADAVLSVWPKASHNAPISPPEPPSGWALVAEHEAHTSEHVQPMAPAAS